MKEIFANFEAVYQRFFTDTGHVFAVSALKIYSEFLIEIGELGEAQQALLYAEKLALTSLGEVHEVTADLLAHISELFSQKESVIDQIDLTQVLP